MFFLFPLMYFLSLPNSVGDLAIWIAHGNYFFETGHILRHDIFTVLPTRELIYPVGASILYATIYGIAGLVGVVLLHKLVSVALSYIWYKSALAHFRSPWSLATLAIIAVSWFGTATLCVNRPALLATVPFVLSFLVIQQEEELSWTDIAKLNVINVVWVNIHGSWLILGLMYFYREVGRCFIRRQGIRPRQLIGLAAIAITSLANPFGYKIIPYVFETSRISKERGIDEWAPTDMSAYRYQAVAYYVLFAAVIALYFYLRKSDKDKANALLASPFMIVLLLGIQSIRNTLWPFFILIPFAYQIGLMSEAKLVDMATTRIKLCVNLVIVVILTSFTIALSPTFKSRVQWLLPPTKQATFDNSAPFDFAAFLNNTPDKDPIFNDWEYGSFLSLSQLHPYFIDTRNIIYSDADFETYLNVVNGMPRWENAINRYNIRYILLNKLLRTKLIAILGASGRWEKVMENEGTIMYRHLN